MLKYFSNAGILIWLVVILIECPSFGFEDQNADSIIVRLCPPPGRELVMKPDSTWVVVCTGEPFSDLMDNPNDWSTTRSTIDYFGYPCWILNDKFSDSLLTAYFTQIDNWGLNFELGVIAIKDLAYATTGEQCYNIESARWERFDSLGATISSLTIDEPYTATVRGSLPEANFPIVSDLEYAVRETADWLELVREDSIVGSVPICLIEAYPYLSESEICDFVDSLQSECASRGIDGIDALSIDYNWCGYPGSSYWNDLIDIEDYCGDNDLLFSMIFWPARSYSPISPDSAFYVDIMYEGNLYFNTYSGDPDIVDVTAWDYTPRVMVPETSPGTEHPFTWAFLCFYDTYLDAKGNGGTSRQAQRISNITSLSPNPSSSGTTIEFNSPDASSSVHFNAFDLSGRVVRSEDIAPACTGENAYTWDGCNNSGHLVSAGIYFVQLTLDGRVSNTSRLMIVRD